MSDPQNRVLRDRFESDDIEEVRARWDVTFPGAQPLLSDAGGGYGVGIPPVTLIVAPTT